MLAKWSLAHPQNAHWPQRLRVRFQRLAKVFLALPQHAHGPQRLHAGSQQLANGS
ncbi:UNVERIFIED_CONTAM: hypothetical protein FKN15_067223 [Acipenser sinensis]